MELGGFTLLLIFGFLPCILCINPGGIQEIPLDDPEVIRLSQVALTKLNEGKQGAGASSLVEVVKASRQIVSGTLTRLTLKVAQGDNKRLCVVKIWEQPWLDKTEVTFEECSEGAGTNTSEGKQNIPTSEHQ